MFFEKRRKRSVVVESATNKGRREKGSEARDRCLNHGRRCEEAADT